MKNSGNDVDKSVKEGIRSILQEVIDGTTKLKEGSDATLSYSLFCAFNNRRCDGKEKDNDFVSAKLFYPIFAEMVDDGDTSPIGSLINKVFQTMHERDLKEFVYGNGCTCNSSKRLIAELKGQPDIPSANVNGSATIH